MKGWECTSRVGETIRGWEGEREEGRDWGDRLGREEKRERSERKESLTWGRDW